MKPLAALSLLLLLNSCSSTETLEGRMEEWGLKDDERNQVVYRTIANPLFGSRLRYPVEVQPVPSK